MAESKFSNAMDKITSLVRVINPNCSKEEIEEAITKLNPENNNYINPYDYCTVEQAMALLELGRNRVRFYEIAKEYNLKVYRNPVNNHPFGYKIKEIKEILAKIKNNT